MRVLMLGGTAEARELADLLTNRPDVHLTVSLAGATRSPHVGDVTTRIGGFGSGAAFRAYLVANAIDRVVDATHPFASRISARTAEIAFEMDVPYLQLLRPAWTPQPGDLWTMIRDEAAARDYVKATDRVFLATGRRTLSAFADMRAAYVWARQIDPPDGPFPFPGGEFLVGRPPFSVDHEIELFTRLEIDWLIVKNAGGEASRSKLDAARKMGLKVLMIERPPALNAPCVETIEEVLAWIDG